MKANETRFDKLLSQVDRKFSIPVYQRKYNWSDTQCTTLWEDIKKLAYKDGSSGHFIGSVVCYKLTDIDLPGEIKEEIIIDGQQRITTLSLLMIAICRLYESQAKKNQGTDLGNSYAKTVDSIKKNFLINDGFNNEDRYKLVPTDEDKDTYFALINHREDALQNVSTRMIENFQLFCDYLGDDIELAKKIYVGINKLDLVYIGLSKGVDNPQIIFESMNSTGMDLSQGDLLRNFLLLDSNTEQQRKLYDDYWRPIELAFGKEGFSERFDYYLRDYITMLEKRIVRLDSGYSEFKQFYEDKKITKEEILKNLRKYSKYYCRIALCKDDDKDLNELWQELKVQRVDTANPFLMQVYGDYEEAQETNQFKLTKDDFIEIIKAVNSYVYRRYIVGIPTNSLNKTFAVLYNSINKQDYKNSVLATLVLLSSYKQFPNDEDFAKAFSEKDIYTTRLKNYTLEKLENNNHLNKVVVDGTDISIEHILPETEVLKPWWQEVLGENWNELQKSNMHRIGNLTITKGVYNSQMQDYSFKKKLEVEGGIKFSNYRLSNDIVYDENHKERESWTIDDINQRSEKLAKQALEIWAYPKLTEDELKPYKTRYRQERVIYEDMAHMPEMRDDIKAIYKALEQAIFQLNKEVTKTITKYYIGYKYDYSNFAEIIIYKNSLNVILDIPYENIVDPKNLTENITDKGSWGTGQVRIKIFNGKDRDYVMNLINQSLDYSINGSD